MINICKLSNVFEVLNPAVEAYARVDNKFCVFFRALYDKFYNNVFLEYSYHLKNDHKDNGSFLSFSKISLLLLKYLFAETLLLNDLDLHKEYSYKDDQYVYLFQGNGHILKRMKSDAHKPFYQFLLYDFHLSKTLRNKNLDLSISFQSKSNSFLSSLLFQKISPQLIYLFVPYFQLTHHVHERQGSLKCSLL